jgi:hypothetical protein
LTFRLQACIVTLQLVQIVSIFYPATLSEVNEDLAVGMHRVAVVVVAVASGSGTCSYKLGLLLFQDYVLTRTPKIRIYYLGGKGNGNFYNWIKNLFLRMPIFN